MTRTDHADAPPTFGGWGRPPQFGFGAKLGTAGTVVGFFGLITLVVVFAVAGFLPALVFAVLLAATLALLTIKDQHHKTYIHRAAGWVQYRRRRARGAHLLAQGTFGKVGYGEARLPGLLAASTLEEWTDAHDRPFITLRVPGDRSTVVTLLCDPNGADLLDRAERDTRTAWYGDFLTRLPAEPNLVGAQVVIETRPGTSTVLEREIAGTLAADNEEDAGQQIARAMLAEVVDTYPVGIPKLTSCVALTFADAGREPDAVAADLKARLPGLAASLEGTGAGAVRPITADQLCRLTKTSYEPSAATRWDHLPLGKPSGLTWDQTGPIHAIEHRDRYEHDGAVSVTYEVSQLPRGMVEDSSLVRLLEANPDIEGKRVAILYRPVPPAAAARAIDRALLNAGGRASSAARSERAKNALAAAEQDAAEEARGAALLHFSILITVTVTDPDRLAQACTTLENQAAACRLTVQRLYGHQAVGFTATQPLGLVTARHLRVPPAIQEAMR